MNFLNSCQNLDSGITTEIERAIAQIVGVISAKLVVAADKGIVEIHVLYAGDRAPKYLAQDIQSLLAARWDIAINKNVISIAQVKEQDQYIPALRFQIESIETKDQKLTSQVSVEFKAGEVTKKGSAVGPLTALNKMRITAEACLNAVVQFLPEEHKLILEAVSIEKVGESEVAVVGVTILTPNQEQTLVGTCKIHRDLVLATTKSVLDALNRRLEILVVD